MSLHFAGFQRRFGLQGGCDEEPRFPFAERQQIAPRGAELHQIALPMAEFLTLFHRFGPLVNRTPVFNRKAAVLKIAPAPTCLGPGQIAVQLLGPDFRAIDVAIDRLVADAVIGSLQLEPAGDLLWRPSHCKAVADIGTEQVQALQL